MTPRHRARAAWNAVNLATPLGLLVAAAGGARVHRGPRGLLIADGYHRLSLPPAPAFTVGNVICLRFPRERLLEDPRLLAHEERHADQWAACLGLPMLPLYLAAAGWSLLRTGDPASRNAFERRAGLADGGYREHPVRSVRALLRRSVR
ncbi:hypothetical protein BIV57_21080 [Mangrovactinospora gilvigrisea]|uniref:DUF4157 domain-containing protein n=1 Tax=Mangrovactinospora gilvigrisea TaxID=1428644 RepID=A0A1J7BA59_9ACTN|nr:hypothetical protein [Mangrovactinospora gilvigrisea]OIV35494.1 hypothetical protein BIV57_21080 [Mangrovactinospora gilvigrisea]